MLRTEGRPAPPHWWRRATRIVLPIAAAVVSLALLAASLPLYPDVLVVGVILSVLCGLGLIWLALLGIQVWRYRWDSAILIAPLIGVLTVAAIASGLMQRIGWAVSENSLTELAQSCDPNTDPGWVGVYPIDAVESRVDGCLLYMDGSLLGPAGIAYLPDNAPSTMGLPAGEGEIGYLPMPFGTVDGPWYRFDIGW